MICPNYVQIRIDKIMLNQHEICRIGKQIMSNRQKYVESAKTLCTDPSDLYIITVPDSA